MVLDKCTVLEWYDDWIVRSARWETRVPAVLMLKEYQRPKHTMRLSKRNIFLRDSFTCQYCDISVTESTATLDHVLLSARVVRPLGKIQPLPAEAVTIARPHMWAR